VRGSDVDRSTSNALTPLALARESPSPRGRGEQGANIFVLAGMSDIENPKTHPTGNAEKNPDDWTTGDEPMTGAQASYLKTLSEEAHEDFEGELSKAEASKKIDALKEKTGR
jgi:hypothetical protein